MRPLLLALMLWAAPTTDARADEVREIAAAIEAAAEISGDSPWRWAALVCRESGVRVDVIGTRGERGPAQVLGRYVGMGDAELATADGGMLGAVRAIAYWRRARPRADPWQCYASGNTCYAPRSVRVLERLERELRALAGGGEI